MTSKMVVRITVHVQPNASQNKVMGFSEGILRVKIAAPPVKGKANQELIKFLSGLLGVSKSQLTIEKGLTGKNKIVVVAGLAREQVFQILEKCRT